MPLTQQEQAWLSSLAQAETLLASLAEQLNHPESSTALTAPNYQAMVQLTSLLQKMGSPLPQFSQTQLHTQVAQRLAKLQATHTALMPRLSHWQDYVEQQQQHVAKQRQQQQAYKCL
jgi:hypothetical protein